jgi:hypothetical protein
LRGIDAEGNFMAMSKVEILEELPKLTPRERSQLFARLAELHEADLISGDEPTATERQALDAAMEEFKRDGDLGKPWRDVLHELRKSRS